MLYSYEEMSNVELSNHPDVEFDVDNAELKAAGQFLNGCKIALIGFSANTFEVLQNVLGKGGATRCDQITHIIMGKQAGCNNNRPHIVNLQWLSDSIKAGRSLDENPYFPQIEQPFLVGNSIGPKCSPIASTPKATLQKFDFSNKGNEKSEKEDHLCAYNSGYAISKLEPGLSMDSDMIKLLAAAKAAENKKKVKKQSSLKSFFKELGTKKPPPIPRKDAVSEEMITSLEGSISVTWSCTTNFQAKDESPKEKQRPAFVVADDKASANKPKFHFAGVSNQEMKQFYKVTDGLGGKISKGDYISPDTTHLIAEFPNETGKYMASVAKGLWVLRKTYLEACEQNNRFVNEEDYEWKADDENKSESKEYKLAEAAKYWRVRINEMRKNNVAICGAFCDWKVLVLAQHKRASLYIGILSAGGAEIVSTKPPFNNLQNVTHAFLEFTRAKKINIDLVSLVERNIFCLKFEFITAFLVGEQNMNDYFIPEVQHLAHKYNIDEKENYSR